jgi:hypothetical protein
MVFSETGSHKLFAQVDFEAKGLFILFYVLNKTLAKKSALQPERH